MNKLFGLILVMSLVCFQTSISYGASYWAKTYCGSHAAQADSIQETSDGGYIVAGATASFELVSIDVWAMKLDNNGNVTWQKTYGGSDLDYTESIQETSDGGYIVVGLTMSFGAGSEDAWIIKLDNNGNVTWQKTYGGIDRDNVYSIQETTDGGYVAAGETRSFGADNAEAWIIKLDNNGNVTWQKTYGGIGGKLATSIQQTRDGGYVVAGRTISGFNADPWIIKLDSKGNVTWQKAYGGSDANQAYSIQETSDGGYVVIGENEFYEPFSFDVWIIKVDSNGDISWQKAYGGMDFDEARSIQETSDGGYIVAGQTDTPFGSMDTWAMKLDSKGNVTWKITYGLDDIRSIQETSDGGYIAAGNIFSSISGDNGAFVLKLDGNGEIPYCDIMQTSNVTITDTTFSVQDTNATITNISVTPNDTTITPVDSSASIITVCGYGTMCKGNFDCDSDCDGSDAFDFKVDFGRSSLGNPCESGNPCNGDFDCDNDCDGTDAATFKLDFGRSGFNNPCPACEVGDWCMYL